MSLAAGRLRHRIDIQQPVRAQDPESGSSTVTWVNQWASVPAAIEPLSAREFIAAQAEQSQITGKIIVRHVEGITAKHRIVHGERIYNIHGVLADPESGLEYLTLPVSEGVNEG